MLKKTFIVCMFGTTFSWFEEWVKHVEHLDQYGWEWIIFTPNHVEGSKNVKIVPMTTDEFNELVEKKLGVRPNMFMTEKGVPSVHITDVYVFSGLIFADYIQHSDFWGIMNLDVVVGRLDHFIPDSTLKTLDIWTDDINAINGVCCLFRNEFMINRLCLMIPQWKEKLTLDPCPKCTGAEGATQHQLAGTDEYDMTTLMKDPEVLKAVRYGYPKYYPIHGYDRLETQVPNVKLSMKDDGSLWELSEDVAPPVWEHAHKYFGREIGYYHFIVTKKWPSFIN